VVGTAGLTLDGSGQVDTGQDQHGADRADDRHRITTHYDSDRGRPQRLGAEKHAHAGG
jgi:hypothetical protein